MNRWIEELAAIRVQGQRCMLLTVAGVRGSAPRETGAKMLVTATETIGTIGGGQLEYACTQLAFRHLRQNADESGFVRRYPLGTNCGQCCGGVVDVLFESIDERTSGWVLALQRLYDAQEAVVIATSLGHAEQKFLLAAEYAEAACSDSACPADLHAIAIEMLRTGAGASRHGDFLLEPVHHSDMQIALFGAGHVGTATVELLARLDSSIRWIDSRKKMFPQRLPTNVLAVPSVEPSLEVAAMPAGTFYLVMTHSHPLDLEICTRILRRGDYAYCGLIGSVAKRRRFERLLRKQGIADDALRQLVCPIGVAGIEGKKPPEIALAVAAEILQTRDARRRAGKSGEKTPVDLRVV
jgi:xanthine dehydrogenase accessory factor